MNGVAYDSAVADAVLHLEAHRKVRGLSRAKLAELADVSRTTVYRLEVGAVGGVDFGVLGALAEVLGVEPAALFLPPPTAPAAPKATTRARAKRPKG